LKKKSLTAQTTQNCKSILEIWLRIPLSYFLWLKVSLNHFLPWGKKIWKSENFVFYLIRMVSSLKSWAKHVFDKSFNFFWNRRYATYSCPTNQQTKNKTKTNLFNCPVHCCYVLLYTLSHSNQFKEKRSLKNPQKTHEKTVTYPQHIQSFLFMRHLRLSLKFSSVSDKNSFCE